MAVVDLWWRRCTPCDIFQTEFRSLDTFPTKTTITTGQEAWRQMRPDKYSISLNHTADVSTCTPKAACEAEGQCNAYILVKSVCLQHGGHRSNQCWRKMSMMFCYLASVYVHYVVSLASEKAHRMFWSKYRNAIYELARLIPDSIPVGMLHINRQGLIPDSNSQPDYGKEQTRLASHSNSARHNSNLQESNNRSWTFSSSWCYRLPWHPSLYARMQRTPHHCSSHS